MDGKQGLSNRVEERASDFFSSYDSYREFAMQLKPKKEKELEKLQSDYDIARAKKEAEKAGLKVSALSDRIEKEINYMLNKKEYNKLKIEREINVNEIYKVRIEVAKKMFEISRTGTPEGIEKVREAYLSELKKEAYEDLKQSLKVERQKKLFSNSINPFLANLSLQLEEEELKSIKEREEEKITAVFKEKTENLKKYKETVSSNEDKALGNDRYERQINLATFEKDNRIKELNLDYMDRLEKIRRRGTSKITEENRDKVVKELDIICNTLKNRYNPIGEKTDPKKPMISSSLDKLIKTSEEVIKECKELTTKEMKTNEANKEAYTIEIESFEPVYEPLKSSKDFPYFNAMPSPKIFLVERPIFLLELFLEGPKKTVVEQTKEEGKAK